MENVKYFEAKRGRRLAIRKPTMKDADALLEFINELIREKAFISYTKQKTKQENAKWLESILEKMKTGQLVYLAVFNGSRAIASLELRRLKQDVSKHAGELAIFIAKDYRGMGLGKFLINLLFDLAKDMKLKMIESRAFANNEVAINMYKKFGFVEVGRMPKEIFFNGEYIDNIIMVKILSD